MQKKRTRSKRKKNHNSDNGAKTAHKNTNTPSADKPTKSRQKNTSKGGGSKKRRGGKFDKFRDSKKVVRIKVERSEEHEQATAQILASWKTKSEELRELPAVPDDQLDDWQQDVLDSLEAGLSIIVDAPTSAGKTRAVEMFFKRHLENPKFRVAYTTPVKSLSNDKYRELSALPAMSKKT